MPKRLTTLYPFSALLVGLVPTQILATAQVYVSNTALYDNLVAIKNAGYLTIPNPQVMGSLREIGPTFFGGLFFTFSIGAGISFFTLALAWVWNRIFYRNKYLLRIYLFIWACSLVGLNIHGFKLFLTLTVLLIPPAVFALVSKNLVSLSRQNRRPNDIIHVIPVVLLALVLAWQIDGRMFTDFRDIYLLSNPIGANLWDMTNKGELRKEGDRDKAKYTAIQITADPKNPPSEKEKEWNKLRRDMDLPDPARDS